MTKQPQFFKLNLEAYFRRTRTLTLEQRGMYVSLMALAAEEGGQLPHSRKDIGRMVGVDPGLSRRLLDELAVIGLVTAGGKVVTP